MKAVVGKMICSLHAEPSVLSELVDEAIYGMIVTIVEDNDDNWCKIQTHYGYEGFVEKKNLEVDEKLVSEWKSGVNRFVGQKFADVLTSPKIQSSLVITLVKGAQIIATTATSDGGEWQEVIVATGEKGWVRSQWLTPLPKSFEELIEEEFRENVVQTALSYSGTPYRWGGKTPLGIDCSGLCSISYMMNGVIIYRDASIEEGFPVKNISIEEMKKGDLLFFPGHVAMYIGDDLYVHSSLGGNEVNINSLNNHHPLYRSDLANSITAVGSIFS